MSSIEILFPLQRAYTLANGSTRRVIERRPVKLRTVEVSELGKVLRDGTGTVMLELDGCEVLYVSSRRESASVESFVARGEFRARRAEGGRLLRTDGRAPSKNVADDGSAALAEAVADIERTHVVVEGCVALLCEPGGVRAGLEFTSGGGGTRAARPIRETVDFPWTAFPLTARSEARAFCAGLAEAVAREMPGAQVLEPAPEGEPGVPAVADRAAAARMQARMEHRRAERWADRLVDLVRPVAGLMGTEALRAYADLRSARHDGEELSGLLRDAAAAIAAEPRPTDAPEQAWNMAKAAAVSLACRLGPVPTTFRGE